MMFSLGFVVVLVISFGVNGQTNDINTFRSDNEGKGYPFGKLRLSEEGKNEELISPIDIGKSQINQDQPSNSQPLPSPCIGASSSTKLAYPRDKTKYIQCRDEFHYEIFTCPNGGEYNDQTNSCDLTIPIIDKCEQEKPCLNDGQCQLISNSTFKCTCRQDWTGDRCETPLNSCVQKPCGPNAECRTLKTSNYEQDYVCVCHEKKGYGLNCQEVVSNPCLTSTEEFFPYAFNPHAYIQCDGELIYFQPCGPLLYWSQENKICDRKRPPKIDLSALLMKSGSNNNENQQEKNEEINLTTTTTEPMEQQNSLSQNTQDNEHVFAFVPARVANRQQLQANMNNQQGQNLHENEPKTQELSGQDFMSRAKQWPNHQTESTIRQPPTMQSGQNQPWSQNNQQQKWTPTLTDALLLGSSIGQSQIKLDNQQQIFPQQNQVFGSQQWLNQVPDMKIQNNQRLGSQSQPWQGSQTVQNQPQFQNQNQQFAFETSTTAQNLNRFQSFQNPTGQLQEQSWQTKPNTQMTGSQSSQTIGFHPQNNQNFVPQTQSWQSSQTLQNQPQFQNQNQQSFIETTTPTQNVARLQDFQNSNTQGQDQSWQTRPNTQTTGSQSPQTNGFNLLNTQNFVPQTQSWQSSQTIQNQPRLQDQNQQSFIETTTPTQNVFRLQGFKNPNTQITGNQSPQIVGFSSQNTQNFVSPKQPWQSFPLLQNQQQLTPTNSEGISTDNKNRLNTGIQQNNQFGLEQQILPQQNQVFGSQQWLNQVPDMKTQNNQRVGSQSQPWQGSQTVQNQPQFQNQNQPLAFETTTTTTTAPNLNRFQNFQNPTTQMQDQSWQTQQIQNQANKPQIVAFQPKPWTDTSKQSLIMNPSSDIQNTQYGFTQQQKSLPIQNSFDQKQSWPTYSQFQPQGNQLTDFDESQIQTTQNFGKVIPQAAVSIQSPRGWPSIQPLEQGNNQITTSDQRKTLDPIPTLSSGSWKSRS